MQKVDMTTWGGTKVRNNLKKVWTNTPDVPADADASMGQYQQALSTGLQNTNELIDKVQHIEGVLAKRPF